MPLLSVVIPVYQAEQTLVPVVESLIETLSPDLSFEVILVNDGSRDQTRQKMEELQLKYPQWITTIHLTKNFGEHAAVMAGYRSAEGQYIVNIDDDGQHPPSEILKLLALIQTGYEAVYSNYLETDRSFFRKAGSFFYHASSSLVLDKNLSLRLNSFRIITEDLKNKVLTYQGPFPYIDGLILENTSKIAQVFVQHSDRLTGPSNYSWNRLVRAWADMFFSSPLKPLRYVSLVGVVLLILGVLLLKEFFFLRESN